MLRNYLAAFYTMYWNWLWIYIYTMYDTNKLEIFCLISYFYAPKSNCFCPVCLSVVNFNIHYNFWTVRDRDFIFGMHTQLMMPVQMTPKSMTLNLTFVIKRAFLSFVATWGTVFHKHLFFQYLYTLPLSSPPCCWTLPSPCTLRWRVKWRTQWPRASLTSSSPSSTVWGDSYSWLFRWYLALVNWML